ncbi:MAG TPA: HisA/HisF-related TIM barrel protein [Candidatus Binatia bacterium]|nr:HisA/HisF-related TIM barrel protein [Candidatus Binatia bacterium]
MIVIPAIDLRGGRCVRLRQGDPMQETQYDADPVARAKQFVRDGAARLHVVDLDGALGKGENLSALRAICAAVDVPVQTGGGVRSRDDVAKRLGLGAAAVTVGTMLVESPEESRRLVEEFADQIIGSVDARGNRVAVRGWQQEVENTRDELIATLAIWGVQRVVYTEIVRDGTGTGFDLAALRHVASLTPMRITASGGAKTIADVRKLRANMPANVDAVIIGRALYEGTIVLREAVSAAA